MSPPDHLVSIWTSKFLALSIRNKPDLNVFIFSSKIIALTTSTICFRLFEEHAELLSMFTKFKELKTKEDQANSLELHEHATTVMKTLDEGIKGLDNLDAFFEYLHHVGASHRRIPGFKVDYFSVGISFSLWEICSIFFLRHFAENRVTIPGSRETNARR